MNQLTVLGGSHAGVGTGQGCSGYLVTAGETRVVLDLGPNTLQELRKHVDYRTLSAIVVSHLHIDHVLDLFAFQWLAKNNPLKPDQPIPLWLPPDGIAFMQAWASMNAGNDEARGTFYDGVYAMQEYDPADALTIGSLTITFAETDHVLTCWAMRIACDGHDTDMAYTADIGSSGDISALVAGVGLLVANCGAPRDADVAQFARLGMTAVQAAEMAVTAGATHLILTHQWEEVDPAANAALAAETFTGEISTATPGLSVTW